jgi:hypothetical protein
MTIVPDGYDFTGFNQRLNGGTFVQGCNSIADKYTTVPIKGKMYERSFITSELDAINRPTTLDEVKRKLCFELAEELFRDNMILFTHIRHPHDNTVHFKARIYVTPKDQTQLIAKLKT